MRQVRFYSVISILVTILAFVINFLKFKEELLPSKRFENYTLSLPRDSSKMYIDTVSNRIIVGNYGSPMKSNEAKPTADVKGGSVVSLTSAMSSREEQKFWIKLGFSLIFSGAALYIILSQKYDPETKKWAVSVLTLVAGVWIGSL
jgi:hypothetical protein